VRPNLSVTTDPARVASPAPRVAGYFGSLGSGAVEG